MASKQAKQGQSSGNLGFSRAQKLARASDIEFVKRTGKRVKTGLLDVRVAASPSSCTLLSVATRTPTRTPTCARVGVIVPKYKRSIVERNRLRRRLREIVRTRMLPVIPVRDVFIRAMPQAYTSSFESLVREIDSVIARIA